jgi:hypothetical protein
MWEIGEDYPRIAISNEEFGYGAVLDDFPKALFINIITYNISPRENELMDLIRSLDSEKEVTIITNIPGRFPKYCGKGRERAATNIKNYLALLDPSKFRCKLSVFFNFKNHQKIIMTNNIAYIGSENFSTESKSNFECGVLFKNPEIISKLSNGFIPYIKSESIGYNNTEGFKIRMIYIKDKFESLYNLIHEGIMAHYDTPVRYNELGEEIYDEDLDTIKIEIYRDDLDDLGDRISEFENLIDDMRCDIDFEQIPPMFDAAFLGGIKELIDLGNLLYKYARFDRNPQACAFAEKYNLMDDDEFSRDHYKSPEIARCVESMADRLDEELTSFLDKLSRSIDIIQTIKKDINKIDNTKT